MKYAAVALIALTALLHLYIAWFEVFAWAARGPSVFETFPADLFDPNNVLYGPVSAMAANQGVYNLFLAIGLIWSLTIKDPIWKDRIALCLLGFVFVAGAAAALTVALKPGLFQMVPSALAMVAVLMARPVRT